MEAITIQELLEAVDGTLLGQADLSRTVSQVDTDSRDIHPGSLFIPLVGERFDGHAYLDAALEAGAAGCLTARPWPERREDRFYIQVAVLDGKALPSIEIIPQADFYDYENKYQPGAAKEVCPAEIPPEWEKKVGEAAQTVFQAIGLSVYARADFIVPEDGTPYFLEINTLPGMTPTSLVPQEAAAVGISYGELCETIVKASLKARKEGA